VKLYPQILVNVRTGRRFDFSADRNVKQAVAKAEAALDGGGRVLLRASGTEPVIRVMVEGKSRGAVERWANVIAGAVRRAAS
jgi:phosphoglucosamine mutase